MPIPANQQIVFECQMAGIASAQGSTAHNFLFTFDFFRAPTATGPNKANVQTAFNTAICAPVLLALNARYTQTYNKVRCVNDATDLGLQVSQSGVGAVSGDPMPMHVSIFHLMRTGLRGRSNRGAKKWGPISEADTTTATGDILNAAAITRFTAIATALAAGFTDSDGNFWQYCIVSKKNSQTRVNPTTVVFQQVLAILLNKRLGRQRKREVASVY